MTELKQIQKTVVITGGSSGIGLESAKLILKDPEFKVVIIGRDPDKLADAVTHLDADESRIFTLQADLSDSRQLKKAAEKIISSQKNLYGLINNAGIYPFGGVTTTTEESWNQTMDLNLKAPFLLIQELAPHLARHPSGGRVINVSSTAGILPNHFALAYSVSKSALIHLTKTLAKELGKDNITVNCVCPGIVKTPIHESYHATETELEEFYARRGAAFPLGRVGESKDIAGSIRFLLSEEASWITGSVSVIDGGRLLL
jgi:NAD(P)-dependent dehydrogenase (short-subunit alcohol dehydrogenase family)